MRRARFDRDDVIPVLMLMVIAAILLFFAAAWLTSDPHASAAAVEPAAAGSCPFYEQVNEKGCVVPPNLTCNADWSHCEPKKDESIPISAPNAAPAASPAVETPSKAINCTDL